MENLEDGVVAPAGYDFAKDVVAPAGNDFEKHVVVPAENIYDDDLVEPAVDMLEDDVAMPLANNSETVLVAPAKEDLASKVGASAGGKCADNAKSDNCPKCTSALCPISAEQLREQRDDTFQCDACNEERKVRSAARGGALICDPCDWGMCGKCVSKSAVKVAHGAALQVAHDAALADALHHCADRRSPSPHPRKRTRGSAAAAAAPATPQRRWDDGVAQMHDDLRYEVSGRLRVVVPMSAAITYARIAGLGQTVTMIAQKAFNVSSATNSGTIRAQLFAALADVELNELLIDLYHPIASTCPSFLALNRPQLEDLDD